jgi:hypothetical protein
MAEEDYSMQNAKTLDGIYSITNLPETTKDVSPMKNQSHRFIVKRRTDKAIKTNRKYKYFILDSKYSYVSSLIPVKDKESVFDFDVTGKNSSSGQHEFYRMYLNLDKGLADVSLKSPVTN